MTPTSRSGRGSRLRELSRSLVLTELADAGPLTQAELGRRTGLSRATVASIVTDLRTEGRIELARGKGEPGRGRPAAHVQLAADSQTVVGVDFGHSHVAVAVSDLNGTILAERRESMDVHNSAVSSLDRAGELITTLIAEVGTSPTIVAVGVPGPVAMEPAGPGEQPTGRVCSGTVLPNWAGYDPAAEIAQRIGLSVIAENDANLGALGEYRFGAGRGVENLVFVKVSSGIGTGLILGGRLYRGSRGASGEIGHVQVREDGALCRCGSRGCLETVSSADAALALLAPAHGRTMTFDDFVALEAAGDPGVLRLLSDMGNAIGKVITVVAANLDPGLVIVGGSMARTALVESIGTAIDRYTQPYVASEMTVVAAGLAERASLMGAVALAIQQAATR